MIEDGYQARRDHAHGREPRGEVYWWPAEWKVTEITSVEHLIVATDVALEAVDFSWTNATTAIAEDGDYALNIGYTQSQIGEVELEALILGIELVADRAPKRATLLSGSREAIEIARHLGASGSGKRRSVSTARSSSTLQHRYERSWLSASTRTLIEIEHVRAHDGHFLNDAADAIASASRRAAMVPRVESERALIRYIDQQVETVTGYAVPGAIPTQTIESDSSRSTHR